MSILHVVVEPQRPVKITFKLGTPRLRRLIYYSVVHNTPISELVYMLIDEKLNELDNHFRVNSLDGKPKLD